MYAHVKGGVYRSNVGRFGLLNSCDRGETLCSVSRTKAQVLQVQACETCGAPFVLSLCSYDGGLTAIMYPPM